MLPARFRGHGFGDPRRPPPREAHRRQPAAARTLSDCRPPGEPLPATAARWASSGRRSPELPTCSSFRAAPIFWLYPAAHCNTGTVSGVRSTAQSMVRGTPGADCSSACAAVHTGHFEIVQDFGRDRTDQQAAERSNPVRGHHDQVHMAGSGELHDLERSVSLGRAGLHWQPPETTLPRPCRGELSTPLPEGPLPSGWAFPPTCFPIPPGPRRAV